MPAVPAVGLQAGGSRYQNQPSRLRSQYAASCGSAAIAFVSSLAPCAHDGAVGSAAAMTSSAAAIRAVLQVVEGFARIYRFSGKLPSRQKLTCQRSS